MILLRENLKEKFDFYSKFKREYPLPILISDLGSDIIYVSSTTGK